MAYGTTFFVGEHLIVADIFSSSLKVTQLAQVVLILLFSYISATGFLIFFPYYYPVRSLVRFLMRNHRARVARLILGTNKHLPTKLFWSVYLRLASWELFHTTLTTFGDDYAQAWREELEGKGGALDLQIFVGKDTFSAPILCKLDNNNVCTVGSDAETFDQLRMWYAWMQHKRGFGESVIPRRLIRVDRVKVCCPDPKTCNDGMELRALTDLRTRMDRLWVRQESSARPSTPTI
jgi:hypothetical protein